MKKVPFSTDGTLMISVGNDGMIRFWGIPPGNAKGYSEESNDNLLKHLLPDDGSSSFLVIFAHQVTLSKKAVLPQSFLSFSPLFSL